MKFVMLRDKVVATRAGHAIEFKAGEATHVVPQCWADVQAAGAVPEGELPNTDVQLPDAPQGAEREAKISDAMKAMVARNARGDFTASGSPAAPALSQILGFAVTASERDEVWVKVQVGEDK